MSLGAVLLVDLALWRGKTGRRLAWRLEPARDPWPRIDRGGPGPALRGVAPWLMLLLVTLAWDVLGIDTGPHQYHLTISALAQAYRPLNAALLLVWMLVGIGYEAARVRAPVGRSGGDEEDPAHSRERGRVGRRHGVTGSSCHHAGAAPAVEPARRRRILGGGASGRCFHRPVGSALRGPEGERRGVPAVHLHVSVRADRARRGVGVCRLPPVRALSHPCMNAYGLVTNASSRANVNSMSRRVFFE